MKYEATIEVDGGGQNLEKAFRSEDKDFMKGRASFEVHSEDDKATITAEAKDASALRAVLDSVAKGIKIHEDVRVMKNGEHGR